MIHLHDRRPSHTLAAMHRIGLPALLGLLWVGLSLTGCRQFASTDELIPLTEGWEIRWGDSPLDDKGVPIWIQEDRGDWQSSPHMARRLVKKSDVLWARATLPELSWNDSGPHHLSRHRRRRSLSKRATHLPLRRSYR